MLEVRAGVAGVEHRLHDAVNGGEDPAVGGDDGDALAHQLFGEGGIGDLGEGNGPAVHGGVELVAVEGRRLFRLFEQFAENTHSNDFLSKCWPVVHE